jgi:hypothetical protein
MKKKSFCGALILALIMMMGASISAESEGHVSVDFKGAVQNDVTGTWRWATANTSEYILNWAADYYLQFFEDDSEIHCVINYGDSTTTCVKVVLGELCVDVHQYLEGEEGDAKIMFGGELLDEQWLKLPEVPTQEPALDISSSSKITFLGVDWYTPKSKAMQLFEEQGVLDDSITEAHAIYTISAFDGHERTKGISSIERQIGYSIIMSPRVAGYDTYMAYISFIYPVQENGFLLKSDDDAQLYLAYYEFSEYEIDDFQAAFDDLLSKLSSLYGEGEQSKTDDASKIQWTDPDGNTVRLIYEYDRDRIYIGYAASDADKRVSEAKAALDAENIAAEAAEREANADDSSGL